MQKKKVGAQQTGGPRSNASNTTRENHQKPYARATQKNKGSRAAPKRGRGAFSEVKREGGEEPTRRCSRLLLYRRKIGVSPAPPAKLNRQAAGRSGKVGGAGPLCRGRADRTNPPAAAPRPGPCRPLTGHSHRCPCRRKGPNGKGGRGADRTNTPPDPSTNRAMPVQCHVPAACTTVRA